MNCESLPHGYRRRTHTRTFEIATSAVVVLLLLTACSTSASTVRRSSEDGSTTIDNELDAVACATSTHCIGVGVSHSYSPFAYQTLIEESTGGAWAIVSSPSSTSGLGSTLYDLACPSAHLCIAVGKNEDSASTPTTLIEQSSGRGWAVVPSPNPTSSGAAYGILNAVTCVSAVDCIAVGVDESDDAVPEPLIEENRGTGWVIVPSAGTGTGDVLKDVACTAAGTCYAVGSAGKQTGNLIMQRINGVWAIVLTSYAPACASAGSCIRIGGIDQVTCSPGGTCVATGIGGYLETGGGAWSTDNSGLRGTRLPSFVTCDSERCIGASPTENDGVLIEEEASDGWSAVATVAAPEPASMHPLVAQDIACAGAVHCLVVGWTSDGASGPKKTLIAEGIGSQWAIASSPNVIGAFASRARTSTT